MTNRRRMLLPLLVVLAMVLAACGDTPEDPTGAGAETAAAEPTTDAAAGATEDATAGGTEEGQAADGGDKGPIRIGISLPLTGDFSEPGKGIQEGYELWAQQVNADGGLLGREVELLLRDDGSDPNTAVSDYEQLITVENVDFVFGPFSSRLVIPTSEVVESYDMVFLEPAGAAPEVFERGLEYLFYAAPAVADAHYDYLGQWILDLPEDQRPATAAVASLDDPFAQATAYGLRDALADGGVEIVADEVYPPEQTDFSSIAARIADTGAEIFIGGTQFEDSVGLVRAFQELGYQPELAAFSTGPTLDEFPEAVGGAANGILSPVGWSLEAQYPSNQEFVEAYRSTYEGDPNEDAANGYTVGQILAQSVEAVQCANPTPECQTAVRDHVRETTFETVVGPLSFDEAGRPQAAHMIQQWIDDNVEIVLPAGSDVQTAEIVFPKPEW